MRQRAIPAFGVFFALLLLALTLAPAHAQNYVTYKVQTDKDGSANWAITQASDLNGTIDTWQNFQLRITDLVAAVNNLTHRDTSIDNNSLQMNTIWETQSHTTKYQFVWLNFSTVQGETIKIGDIFQVKDFFSRLYGDGEIQISCPSNYTVQSVSPQPNGGDTSAQTLDWLGTQFFITGNPSITMELLSSSSPSPSTTPKEMLSSFGLSLFEIVAIVAAAVVSVFFAVLFLVRRGKIKKDGLRNSLPEIETLAAESEEQKIIKVLITSGGSSFQSVLNEKCRFSKAKTSQLLAVLERKGMVTRYKRGRDKIVNLTEKGKGEMT